MTDKQAQLKRDGERAQRADAFLRGAGWTGARRTSLAGDASNRKYERVTDDRLGRAVLMDAPPQSGEDIRPFAALTGLLRDSGFSAPEIYAADAEHGFLLLEDLGDDLFAQIARRRPELEETIYSQAVDLLAEMHARPAPTAANGAGFKVALDPYDGSVLLREARLLTEWYLPAATGAPVPEDRANEFDALLEEACAPLASAKSTLVLRDYHAENLIWRPERQGSRRVALLDYQDALIGHRAYDLVSLLEDARRDVDEAIADRMIERYLERSEADADAFKSAFHVLGAQRNLKIIGIFARLWRRDGKDKYLAHIPRVWRHLQNDLRAPELGRLREWIATHAPPPEASVLDRIRHGSAL